MISAIVSRIIILLFGNLYPAYASYKAVRTKNVKEYVKWMMYWIVFAFFSCIETFTDIFLAWFPFYYEVKVILVLWLLSPATKGSSTLYRKFVHPMLTKRENEIDEYISQAKEKGYTAVLQLGSKGVNYATSVIMQTAIKGGGNLVQTLRKSYSLSDLSEPDMHRTDDEVDDTIRSHSGRLLRSRTQSTRSASGGRQMEMYFSEVDVNKPRESAVNYSYSNVRSSEDISSGYSSAEPISTGLSRTASLTNASRSRLKGKKTEEGDDYDAKDNSEIETHIVQYSYPMFSESDEIHLVDHDVTIKHHHINKIIKNYDEIIKWLGNRENTSVPIYVDEISEIVPDDSSFKDLISTSSDTDDDEFLEPLTDLESDPIQKIEKKKPAMHKKGRAPPPPSVPPHAPMPNLYIPALETLLDDKFKETII